MAIGLGLSPVISPRRVNKTSNPTVNDDILLGYYEGDFWINDTTPAVYQCTDNAAGAAVWILEEAVATAANVIIKTSNVFCKAIIIESPTSTEDLSLFYADDAITVTKMTCVMVGTSPSVTWTVRHHTDRSNAGNEVVTGGTTTTSTTTGSVVTAFNDATIPADSFVWVESTAQSGTVTSMNLTIYYTID